MLLVSHPTNQRTDFSPWGSSMSTDTEPSDSGDEPLKKNDHWGFSRFTRRAAAAVAMVTFVVLGGFVVWQLLSLILVLFLGVLFAIFLRGLTDRVADYTPLTDHWALLVVTAVLVIAFGGTGWLMAAPIGAQAAEIGDKIPEAVQELHNWLEASPLGARTLDELAALDPTEVLSGEILGPLGGAIFGVAGAVTHLAFVLAVGVYLAFDPEVYKRGMVRMVPMNYRERAEEIIDVCSHQLAWWLVGRLMAMLAVAVMITVGLLILGVPLPFFLGLIAGLLSFVPILGPLVSWVPAALIAFLVGPQYVIWTALLYLGAQGIESYFITPMVQQRVVSLPHAMTLIAEIFAGILFGLIGITVATPLAVLLMALINMIYVEDVLGDTTPFTELAEKYHR